MSSSCDPPRHKFANHVRNMNRISASKSKAASSTGPGIGRSPNAPSQRSGLGMRPSRSLVARKVLAIGRRAVLTRPDQASSPYGPLGPVPSGAIGAAPRPPLRFDLDAGWSNLRPA